MPTLDTGKLMDLIAELPDRQMDTPSQGSPSDVIINFHFALKKNLKQGPLWPSG